MLENLSPDIEALVKAFATIFLPAIMTRINGRRAPSSEGLNHAAFEAAQQRFVDQLIEERGACEERCAACEAGRRAGRDENSELQALIGQMRGQIDNYKQIIESADKNTVRRQSDDSETKG